MIIIGYPTLPLRKFFLCLLTILLCFSYNYSRHRHNYYASMMNTFESEYPFSDFLEYYKFDELSKYPQSNFQKKSSVNSMSEGNIPIHDLIFFVGGRQRVFIPSSFLFSLSCIIPLYIERILLTVSSRFYMIFMGVSLQPLKIYKHNLRMVSCL